MDTLQEEDEFSGLRIDEDAGDEEEHEQIIPVWETHLQIFEIFRMLLPQTTDNRLPQAFTLALIGEYGLKVSTSIQQLQALLTGYSNGI